MYCIDFMYNCINYISSFFKEFYYEYNSKDIYNDAIYEEEMVTLVPTKTKNMKTTTCVNTDFDDGFEFIDKFDRDIV